MQQQRRATSLLRSNYRQLLLSGGARDGYDTGIERRFADLQIAGER
jgi:hypothetical protein